MARIDAFVLLVPLAAYVAYELWSGPGDVSRRRHLAFLGWLSAGAAVSSLIGAIDLELFSPVYVHDLRSQVVRIVAGLFLVVIGGGVALVLKRGLAPLRGWADRNRVPLANAAVVLGALGAFYAYVLRPHVELGMQSTVNTLVQGLQGREHQPINGQRTYAEFTMRWLGFYLGPALVACIAGLLLLIRRTMNGRSKYLVPFLLVMVSLSALYIWTPQITPDQLWAMRRYVPVTLPGLLVGCFWLVDRMLNRRMVASALGIVVAVAAIAYPAYVQAGYMTERTQLGLLGATRSVCDALPDNAAVIVAQSKAFDRQFTETVRTYCDVPAANVPIDEPASWYRLIAQRWAAQGRVLYALSPNSPFGTRWPQPMRLVANVSYHDLRLTITTRPHGLENMIFSVYVVQVPT